MAATAARRGEQSLALLHQGRLNVEIILVIGLANRHWRLLDRRLADGDQAGQRLLTQSRPGNPGVQFRPATSLDKGDDDLVGAPGQLRLAADFLGSVNPIVVHDLLVIDVQLAAVVAVQLEGVVPIPVEFEIALELDAEIVAPASDSQVKRGGDAGTDRLEFVEVGDLVPGALVVGVLRCSLRRSQIDLDPLKQEAGDVLRVLGGNQVRHPATGPDLLGVFQERGQAGNGVFRFQIAQRHGGGQDLVGVALRISRAVTGDATDLVVGLPAEGDSLEVGPLLSQSAGRGQEMHEGFDLATSLGIAGEQSGHGRARLDGLRIVQELPEKTDAHPGCHVIEDGSGLPPDGGAAALMAAGTVQLAQQQLAAPGAIGLVASVEALETGHKGMFWRCSLEPVTTNQKQQGKRQERATEGSKTHWFSRIPGGPWGDHGGFRHCTEKQDQV